MGDVPVTKQTVSRIFIGSAIAVVAGTILLIAAVWLAYANGAFVMDGPDVVGVRGSAFAWTTIGLAIVGGLTMIGGFVGGLVSWIGALLNTAPLPDKTWFLLLVLLGVWNLGVIAMIAYLIAGPDGARADEERTAAITAATSVAVMRPK